MIQNRYVFMQSICVIKLDIQYAIQLYLSDVKLMSKKDIKSPMIQPIGSAR